MQNLNFAPLYRATVGFDRIADLMDRVLSTEVAQPTYPPYNIEKTAEDAYRISIAVAGFGPDDLTVEVKDGALYVSAKRSEEASQKAYLHRGIAARDFEQRFQLANHVKVTTASFDNGMLTIELVREVPEALKPRKIIIDGGANVQALEQRQAA